MEYSSTHDFQVKVAFGDEKKQELVQISEGKNKEICLERQGKYRLKPQGCMVFP